MIVYGHKTYIAYSLSILWCRDEAFQFLENEKIKNSENLKLEAKFCRYTCKNSIEEMLLILNNRKV